MQFMSHDPLPYAGQISFSQVHKKTSSTFDFPYSTYRNTSFRILDPERFDDDDDQPNFQHSQPDTEHDSFTKFSTIARKPSLTDTLGRRYSSESNSSMGSMRRSVTGMKKLMPLRLQARRSQPRPQMSSWLSSLSDETMQPPLATELETSPRNSTKEGAINEWTTDERLKIQLHPREIPYYHEAQSPACPSPVYFDDKNLCQSCPAPTTNCDEIWRIVSHYEEEISVDSQSLSSFTQADTFDQDIRVSLETSNTSCVSTRLSGLSYQCKGIEWMNDNSSRASSAYNLDDEEVLKACATPLAPARATMVQVLRSPLVGAFQGESFTPPRPSTPFRSRRKSKRGSSMADALPTTPIIENDETVRIREREHKSADSPPNLIVETEIRGTRFPSPKSSSAEVRLAAIPPSTASSVSSPSSQFIACNFELNHSIVENICLTLENFPNDMLFLDTPCIWSIRHLNALQNDVSRGVEHDSQISASDQPYKKRSSRYRLRRFNGNSLFGGIRSRKLMSKLPPKFSPNMSIPNLRQELATPNLHPLQKIFPSVPNAEWWHSLLYAFLLAYNFVLNPINPDLSRTYIDDSTPFTPPSSATESRQGTAVSGSNRSNTSPKYYDASQKASRTLGLVFPTSPYLLGYEAKLEEARTKLEDCIAKIVDCMVSEGEKVPRTFVRALVEVIRGCENLC